MSNLFKNKQSLGTNKQQEYHLPESRPRRTVSEEIDSGRMREGKDIATVLKSKTDPGKDGENVVRQYERESQPDMAGYLKSKISTAFDPDNARGLQENFRRGLGLSVQEEKKAPMTAKELDDRITREGMPRTAESDEDIIKVNMKLAGLRGERGQEFKNLGMHVHQQEKEKSTGDQDMTQTIKSLGKTDLKGNHGDHFRDLNYEQEHIIENSEKESMDPHANWAPLKNPDAVPPKEVEQPLRRPFVEKKDFDGPHPTDPSKFRPLPKKPEWPKEVPTKLETSLTGAIHNQRHTADDTKVFGIKEQPMRQEEQPYETKNFSADQRKERSSDRKRFYPPEGPPEGVPYPEGFPDVNPFVADHAVIHGALTKEECEGILSWKTNPNYYMEPGTVAGVIQDDKFTQQRKDIEASGELPSKGYKDMEDYDNKYRIVNIYYDKRANQGHIPEDSILNKIIGNIMNFNSQNFQFDCGGVLSGEWPTLFEYNGVDGGHYDWHIDVFHTETTPVPALRKISMTVMISDPKKDFEGGGFEFQGSPMTVPLKQGDICVFPSYIPHRIQRVTKGQRNVIVGWIHGPSWR